MKISLSQRSKLPVTTFHLSSLSEEEEQIIKNDNQGPDQGSKNFKIQSTLLENEQNYALSICFRKTYIRQGKTFYEIAEPERHHDDHQKKRLKSVKRTWIVTLEGDSKILSWF